MPKKGAWTVWQFKGGGAWQERGGGVFEGGGGYPNAHYENAKHSHRINSKQSV